MHYTDFQFSMVFTSDRENLCPTLALPSQPLGPGTCHEWTEIPEHTHHWPVSNHLREKLKVKEGKNESRTKRKTHYK